jgi:hypothetical protein
MEIFAMRVAASCHGELTSRDKRLNRAAFCQPSYRLLAVASKSHKPLILQGCFSNLQV